jgi:hypothetical protein
MNYSKLSKTLKRNPFAVLCGVGAVLITIANIPTILRDGADNQSLRDKAKSIEVAELSAEMEREAAQKMLAKGCTIALDADDPSQYADIFQGMSIALPDGTLVCSRKGSIGTVKGGKLTAVNYAGQPLDVGDNAKRVYSSSVKIHQGAK